MTLTLLPSVQSMIRTSERMDRLSASLPAFKATAMAEGEIAVLKSALDEASKADSPQAFLIWMDAAQFAVMRMEKHLAGLKAEIRRGKA
jgi:hypothetical protein